MVEPTPEKSGFKLRVVAAFRPKPAPVAGKLQKQSPSTRNNSVSTRVSVSARDSVSSRSSVPVDKRGSIDGRKGSSASRVRELSSSARASVTLERVRNESLTLERVRKDSQTGERSRTDSQTGESGDYTALIHSLADHESEGVAWEQLQRRGVNASSEPGQRIMARLSRNTWARILERLPPSDIANLAFTCKTFRDLLGTEAWEALNEPEHREQKINFLNHMDKDLRDHLLCHACAKYHPRINPGQETLKPTNIANPIFNCPQAGDPTRKLIRTRLTPGRALPFTFLQLALRAHHNSLDYGISPDALSRRWKDPNSTWSHQTRYLIHNGHLLLRVVSTSFASPGLPPSGLRHFFYSREDFTPYFSACSHWRDGELMNLCKCALSHIPVPPRGLEQELKHKVANRLHPQNPIISLCEDCKPMRRCPDCPTEYLIQLKLMEDKSDPDVLFKQAITVTRWTDLGDATSPWSPEWASCNGEVRFDSFTALGKRAISGIFESHFNGVAIPGQRMLSVNPKNERLGEAGHNWY